MKVSESKDKDVKDKDVKDKDVKDKDVKDKDVNKQKKKYERCNQCNKKLKMMSFTCKCGLKYCVSHQNPHSHNCSYDYKSEKCKIIEKNNPKLSSKLLKI